MKIGIIGANGQLGHDLVGAFSEKGDEVFELNHNRIEISDIDSVSSVLKQVTPDIVINTAAMHNLEVCEKEPRKSFDVNGIGARNLALVSNEIDSLLIHFSTDYVFDGLKKTPYIESDLPSPLNVYGNTKLSGEHFIRSIARKHLVLRVSGLYGHSPCRAKGLNFVDLMLKLARERDEIRVVNDEELSPTTTEEIARQVVSISEMSQYGLYHVATQGSCTWFEFAKAIFELTKSKVKLSIADPSEFPLKVPRPKYSVLENHNLENAGINKMGHWRQALQKYIDTRNLGGHL